MKTCKKCLRLLPPSAYAIGYKNGNAHTYTSCIDCRRELTRKANRRHSSYEERKDRLKIYRENNKEKLRARSKVYLAVKNGKLVKQVCRDCGVKDAHAHHHDYSKPLEVIWLCPICHFAEHKKQNLPW